MRLKGRTQSRLEALRFFPLAYVIVGSFISGAEARDDSAISRNPLIYTRLPHDFHYLQLFRSYQTLKPYEERARGQKLVLNVTNQLGGTREVEYVYYENKQVDADSIKYDDLVIEALDRTYKTRLIPAYQYSYSNLQDAMESSDKSLTSNERCRRELHYLLNKMPDQDSSRPLNPELATFFDSYAREEPGLLLGNYHWTGAWRQCHKRLVIDLDRSNRSNSFAFRGRYCVASIRSNSWDEKIAQKTKELLENGHYFKYDGQQYDYARFFRIQVGICLPESCDSLVGHSAGDEVRRLALHRLGESYKSYNLTELFCLPDETSNLRKIEPSGKLLIVFISLWCGCVLLATFLDMNATTQPAGANPPSGDRAERQSSTSKPYMSRKAPSKTDKFISAMSLRRNWYRITETDSIQTLHSTVSDKALESGQVQMKPPKPAPNDLLFLNAFKVISMPIILWGHSGMLGKQLDRFALDYEALSEFFFHSHVNAVFLVDWFFVITGFVTTYIMFVTRRVERNTTFQWLYSLFHRYWRLAPLYILLFWFSRSLFVLTSSGPVWDYGTSNNTIRAICRRESWLTPLSLTANFHPLHEECIMPAWYISNDMQFFILTPLLLLALHKQPYLAWLFSILLIHLGVLLRFHRYWTDPRANHIELMRPRFDTYMRNNWDMHATYIYPQYRFGAYLIGVLGGHYAYMVLSGKWRSILYESRQQLCSPTERPSGLASHLRKLLFGTGFVLVLSMSMATWLIFNFFPQSLEPQVKLYTSLIYAVDHMTVSLGLVLMFVTLMFGAAPSLKRFLTKPFWTVCSRINFFVFLVQVEIIYWFHQGSERVVDLSDRELVRQFLSLAGLTYAIATVVTLWLELPLAHLEREFIGSRVMASARPLATQSKASAAVAATTAQYIAGGSAPAATKRRPEEVSQPVDGSCSETTQLVAAPNQQQQQQRKKPEAKRGN